MQISHQQAQQIMLTATGLDHHPLNPATKEDVQNCIRQMGVLQIDTISVVARSPYFVLWSRLGEYDQNWLDELLAEGKLFEYWSHAACFLPIEDYALYRTGMITLTAEHFSAGTLAWVERNREKMDQMLQHIRENGEVRSADFERAGGAKGNGWWDRKEEKTLLEMLFHIGEVMIARRDKFQRIYNLREKVLPDWHDSRIPTKEEIKRTFTLRAIKSLGITTAAWVADYYRHKKAPTITEVRKLADEGALLTVEVEGWNEPAYIHPDNHALLQAAANDQLTPTYTVLLSPFDPLVWDRDRALKMFNFDYRIECYTPESKRRYGYFTLPILWRGQLIGRIDAKAHRKEKRFEIKALHLEPGVTVTDQMLYDLAAMLHECATWHKTPDIHITRSDPPEVAKLLTQTL